MHPIFSVLIEALHSLDEKIAVLDAETSRRAEEDEDARRLKTIPGFGPVTAAAISALAPPAQTFARGRDFAALLELTSLQGSTGGKQRLGETSKSRAEARESPASRCRPANLCIHVPKNDSTSGSCPQRLRPT